MSLEEGSGIQLIPGINPATTRRTTYINILKQRLRIFDLSVRTITDQFLEANEQDMAGFLLSSRIRKVCAVLEMITRRSKHKYNIAQLF